MPRWLFIFGVCLLLCSAAPAATIPFSGNFGVDDQVQWFAADSGGDLRVATTSFAQGGFAPVIAVFAGFGGFDMEALDHNSPACVDGRAADPATSFCWDAVVNLTGLTPGRYLIALSEDDNYPFGTGDAPVFPRQGQGNFTGPNFLGLPGSFVLADGSQRTSAWALEITANSATAVPEPGSLWGAGAGLLLLGVWRRRGAITGYRRRAS